MSARYLKKILKEQEEEQLKSKLESNPVEDDESPPSSAPFRNPFDLLGDEEDEEESSTQENEGESLELKPVIIKNAESNSSFNRKSKKKKKKSKEDSTGKAKADKSLDSVLEDLSISIKSDSKQIMPEITKAKGQTNTKQNSKSFVLAVDPKFLKAENELRKIFGSKVVNSFENEHNNIGSSRLMRGGRRPTHSLRKTILVSPLNFWPPWDNFLTMELLETKDGVLYFRYAYSSSYGYAQETFEAAKAANDLNAIATILGHHPYHVDSLLTFADIFKYSGEHQSSADAIAKCLYALECAWHPLFTPTQGNCQLKYSHDSNKPLFSALFCHMKNMDRRGCHRSALEVCKFLLSLDSDDPKGVLFCIDYFALRAEEYSWLEQFIEEYKTDYSLWLFPNFSYALAVSRFYLEQNAEASKINNDKAASRDLMKQALLLHPSVVKKLVEKAPLKDSAWTQILKNSFFASAKAGTPSLDHLINIYVERSYILWRLPELQNFLKEAALFVIESLKENQSEAKDWECVRKEAFPSERNEYSHLMVSDFSDVIPSIPPEELRHFMIGPQVQHEMPDGNGEAVNERPRAPREVAGRNPVVVFLESILPFVDYGHRNEHMDDEN